MCVCVCVSNWAVLRVWRALESMLVGHQATKPPIQRAATLVGRAPATLPPSQLAQLPTTATSPPCPTLSRLECATTQRAPRDVCLTTNKGFRLGAQVRETCLSMCLPTKVGCKGVHFLLLRRIPPGWTGESIPTTTCTGHPAFTMLSTGFGYPLLVPRCFLLLPLLTSQHDTNLQGVHKVWRGCV